MTPAEWRQKHPRCRFCKYDKISWDQAFCEVKQNVNLIGFHAGFASGKGYMR